MANAMQGLRVKRKYEDRIGVAFSDGLGTIKFPNRDAKFLRGGFVLSQLDGEGMRIMENNKKWQAKTHIKNMFKNRLLQTLVLISMM